MLLLHSQQRPFLHLFVSLKLKWAMKIFDVNEKDVKTESSFSVVSSSSILRLGERKADSRDSGLRCPTAYSNFSGFGFGHPCVSDWGQSDQMVFSLLLWSCYYYCVLGDYHVVQ